MTESDFTILATLYFKGNKLYVTRLPVGGGGGGRGGGIPYLIDRSQVVKIEDTTSKALPLECPRVHIWPSSVHRLR